MAGAGVKVLAAAGGRGRAGGAGGLSGFGVLGFQVGEIRLAAAAADGVDVELDVSRFFVSENTQEEAAELLARGARQSVATPDVAQRMNARVAAGDDLGQLAAKLWIATEGVFDRRHGISRQRFVEIGGEIGGRVIHKEHRYLNRLAVYSALGSDSNCFS